MDNNNKCNVIAQMNSGSISMRMAKQSIDFPKCLLKVSIYTLYSLDGYNKL